MRRGFLQPLFTGRCPVLIYVDNNAKHTSEVLYDFLTTKFSFAFGYYLVINQDFILKKFK